MKIAIVTDFLNQLGGAEKVTAEIFSLYPNADIYTMFASGEVRKKLFTNARIIEHPKFKTSAWRQRNYRKLFPFYPLYFEDFDFTTYDLVISSSYLWAKGILVHPDTVHISYIHTPIRQAWTKYHEYINNENDVHGWQKYFLRYVMNYIRIWDTTSANRVDYFIANSSVVQKRISKIYRRDSVIIHPPIQVDKLMSYASEDQDEYYITTSRLVPYKRIDIMIEAFNRMPQKKFFILGDGNDKNRLKKLIRSKNIQLMGYVDEQKKHDIVSRAKAFLFAAEEDFGMSPVEAMAYGVPVIAYNKGGVNDYMVEGLNGIFFGSQDSHDIIQAIRGLEDMNFDRKEIQKSVARFDIKFFKEKFKKLVDGVIKE